MSINDKIKQILIDKNVTPSYFADEIGVQRSSISHILSGRNRPSFDIIQKIIRRFPELGYEWIMEEETQLNNPPVPSGYPNRNPGRSAVEQPNRFSIGQPVVSAAMPSTGVRNQRSEIPATSLPASPIESGSDFAPVPISAIDKRVERILIFYTDGSFREYMPANS